MRSILITQSNYIPWKGFFDGINQVDEMILYDDMQYTRRDWRNRNLIKTKEGLKWLTIPVEVKGKYYQKINETKVSDRNWAEQHWRTITHSYARAPYFNEYNAYFAALYEAAAREELLSKVNYLFISKINDLLGIKTSLLWSSEFELAEGKTERLVDLCKKRNAEVYYSGPAAKAYMDEQLFARESIVISYFDYGNYPEYSQLHPPFEHGVSILDLLFNQGPNSKKYMKSFGYVTAR